MGNLRKITVEPVMFLCFAGLYYYQLVRDTGIYRQFCVEKFSPNENLTDLTTICGQQRAILSNFSDSTALSSDLEEDQVQKRATLIIMILSLAVITPAMISDLILSALSDRFGRKVIILIGIGGTLVSILPLIAYFTFPNTVPLYSVIGGNLVAGVSGSLAIVLVDKIE
uniref:Major facilitator superfamily (MFS) profile domain-containing protein n=1 Tax=Romanomermis culicivorax TaxID=13658 RepID=A0A915KT54_ROMCU